MKICSTPVGFFIYCLVLTFSAAGGANAAERPNLVFVFSDQQSWDMLGCYGNDQVISPNLDRLASEGVRFNHCVSNSPLCTPYRGILLSGQHPLRNGAMENDVRMLPGEGKYFAEVLQGAGYRTGYYGKWHLYGGNRVRPIPRGPYRYGFDHEFLTNNCTVVYDAKRSYYWDENDQKRLYGEWESDAQTRQTMGFIDKHSKEPFALFLSWHPPHNWVSGNYYGYGAPPEFLEMYDPAAIRLRPNVEESEKVRVSYQGHMAMITSLDRAFGRLMDKLAEYELEKNTLVVFTSDHGDAIGSHGNDTHKLRPELESIRVPLIMRYPAVLRPRVSDLLVGTLDLMPTVLGLMGISAPETCQGNDLSGAIVKADDDTVESVPLFLLAMDWRGIYTRRYSYAMDTSQGEQTHYRDWLFKQPLKYDLLFDRQTDPWELENLVDNPAYLTLKEELRGKTLEWMKKLGDTGLPYIRLAERTKTPEDLEAWLSKNFGGVEGGLVGCPADLVKDLNVGLPGSDGILR